MNCTPNFVQLLAAAIFTIIASAGAVAQSAAPLVADEHPDGEGTSSCGCEVTCMVPRLVATGEVTAIQLSEIEEAAAEHRSLSINGGRFHLEFPSDNNVELVLADSQGRQLGRHVRAEGVHSFDLETSSLPAGEYLLQLTTNDRSLTVPLTIAH